ncbi:hypothetical protein SRHO_G00094070 [Serrasalmus rhombeus]
MLQMIYEFSSSSYPAHPDLSSMLQFDICMRTDEVSVLKAHAFYKSDQISSLQILHWPLHSTSLQYERGRYPKLTSPHTGSKQMT